MIPISRPQLPFFDKYKKYLAQIDNNRVYSNFGTVTCDFEKRIATKIDLSPDNVTTISNATLGITCALNVTKKKGRKFCLLPSWTFIATAAAVVNAGLEPFFIDVDKNSWVLDKEKLKKAIEENSNQIAAIIVVSPFGENLNLQEWKDFSKEYDIPIIIDAAASFDSFIMKKMAKINSLPVIVSLHATKIFGVGEGGLIISSDTKLIKKIRSISNFAIEGQHKGQRIVKDNGTNAKLSEFNSAIGHGFLDDWKEYSNKFSETASYYKNKLQQNNISYFYPHNSLSSTMNIIVNDADSLMSYMESKGIMSKKWWDNACHNMEYYRNFPHDDLTVTNYLTNSVLGIPFFIDISRDEIDYITSTIKEFICK